MAARHLFGVAIDGASATPAPVATTSTAARSKERGRSRAELNERTDNKSVPSTCPTREIPMVFHG
jgi:hypothetical protein